MNWYRINTIVALFLMLLNNSLKAQIAYRDYIDYHVHLQDSATVQLGYRMLKAFGQTPTKMDSLVLDADTIIARLNRAKFKKAWILSNAYWFGSPILTVDNEYDEVKKQNDWTAEQVARYPERLTAFMSVNPLKPYALKEIQRCLDSKHFAGIKLHLANSKVNLFDKAQLEQLQKVFTLANKNRLLLLIHFRNGSDWNGKTNAEILVKHLLPLTKQSKVVLAHMSGWGDYDKPTDDALNVINAYIHKTGSGNKNLYFDLSAVLPIEVVKEHQSAKGKESWEALPALKKRIKQIGVEHILFGTDWPLIDMEDYIKILDSTLDPSTVQKILKNEVE